jgi:hypothetical protein
LNFLAEHATLIGLAAAYIGLAFVAALPEPGDPRPVGQKLYATFYTAAHLLANKAIEKRPNLAFTPAEGAK